MISAATTIQSGEYTLLPGDFAPYFTNHERLEWLCREVNSILALRRDFEEATRSADGIYFAWSKKKSTISIIFPTFPVVQIAEGAHKKIFGSVTVEVSFARFKEIKTFHSVLIHLKDDPNIVYEGNSLHEKVYALWLRERPPEVYIAEPMVRLQTRLYTQRRYNSDLYFFLLTEQPLETKFALFEDMRRSIAWLHRQGVIHGDIKTGNFLIQHKTRVAACMADFDFAGTSGRYAPSITCLHSLWDPCSSFTGVMTPYRDWYALALMYVLTFVPIKFSPIDLMQIRYRVADNLNADNLVNVTPLSPLHKRMWQIFIDICKESAKLYQRFKAEQGPISKEQVDAAIGDLRSFNAEEHFNIKEG